MELCTHSSKFGITRNDFENTGTPRSPESLLVSQSFSRNTENVFCFLKGIINTKTANDNANIQQAQFLKQCLRDLVGDQPRLNVEHD